MEHVIVEIIRVIVDVMVGGLVGTFQKGHGQQRQTTPFLVIVVLLDGLGMTVRPVKTVTI